MDIFYFQNVWKAILETRGPTASQQTDTVPRFPRGQPIFLLCPPRMVQKLKLIDVDDQKPYERLTYQDDDNSVEAIRHREVIIV